MSYLPDRDRMMLTQRPDDWLGGGGARGSSYAMQRSSSSRSIQQKASAYQQHLGSISPNKTTTTRPTMGKRGYSSNSLNAAATYQPKSPFKTKTTTNATSSSSADGRPTLNGQREDSSNSLCSHGSVSRSVADRQANILRQLSSSSLSIEQSPHPHGAYKAHKSSSPYKKKAATAPNSPRRPAQEQAERYRQSQLQREQRQQHQQKTSSASHQQQQDDPTEDPTETSSAGSSSNISMLKEVGKPPLSLEDEEEEQNPQSRQQQQGDEDDYWFYNNSNNKKKEKKSSNDSLSLEAPSNHSATSYASQASLNAFRNAEETRMRMQQKLQEEKDQQKKDNDDEHKNSRSVQALVSPARRRESLEDNNNAISNNKEEEPKTPVSTNKKSSMQSQFDLAKSWASSPHQAGHNSSSSSKALVEAVAKQHSASPKKPKSPKKKKPSKDISASGLEGAPVTPKPHKNEVGHKPHKSPTKSPSKSPKRKVGSKPKVKKQQQPHHQDHDNESVSSHTSTRSTIEQRKREHAALLERAHSLSQLHGPSVQKPSGAALLLQSSTSSSSGGSGSSEKENHHQHGGSMKKSNSSGDLLAKFDLQSRKEEKAKRIQKAKERIQRQEQQAKEDYVSLERRRERAYFWYIRLGTPNRADMKEMVMDDKIVDCEPNDVDLLPWRSGGYVVNATAMLKYTSPH